MNRSVPGPTRSFREDACRATLRRPARCLPHRRLRRRLDRWALSSALLHAVAILGAGCAGHLESDRGAAAGAGAAAAEPVELRVMTFNIRYGTAADGADAWDRRRALLIETIRSYDPAVLGVQEALRFQLDEIGADFPGMKEVGVGRDDGAEAGEYSSILYDGSRFALREHGTYWLSDTPGVPGSMTWGNRYPRLVTWALLHDTAADLTFYVLNTHWDHESQNARERSAAQVVDWLAASVGDRPVVVMGDFNAGESNPAFRALLDADRRVRLRDSFRDVYPGAGGVGTYHAFTGDRTGEKIDAVLVSPAWEVVDAAIVRTNRAGRYPSDHFPVTATLVWRGDRDHSAGRPSAVP